MLVCDRHAANLKSNSVPARVVIVLDEPGYAEKLATVLARDGVDVKALPGPMVALDAFDSARKVELLITCPEFAPGKPNGIALVRMAKNKRPSIKALFVGDRTFAHHAADLGEFIPTPINVMDLACAAARLLESAD